MTASYIKERMGFATLEILNAVADKAIYRIMRLRAEVHWHCLVL